MDIDLSPFLNSIEVIFPDIDMPDGPRWEDRVLRAKYISKIVIEKQEELLDRKMAMITKIKRKLLDLNMIVEVKLDILKIKSSSVSMTKDEIIEVIRKILYY